MGGRTFRAPRASSSHTCHWLSVNLWPRQATVTYQNALAGLYTLSSCTEHFRNPVESAEMSVSRRTPDLGVGGRLEKRAAASVAQKIVEGSKTAASQSFRNIRKLLKGPAEQAVVCVLTGGGTRLRHGALQLARNSVLLLDASCRGVTFQNMSFSGAASALLVLWTAFVLQSTFAEGYVYECSAVSWSQGSTWRQGVTCCASELPWSSGWRQ